MYIEVKIGQLDSFVIHQRVMAQNYARKCSVLGFTSRHFLKQLLLIIQTVLSKKLCKRLSISVIIMTKKYV